MILIVALLFVLVLTIAIAEGWNFDVFPSRRPATRRQIAAVALAVTSSSGDDNAQVGREDTIHSQQDLNVPIGRRRMLCCFVVAAGTLAISSPSTARAEEDTTTDTVVSTANVDRKPYAPLENLLPATRVKVLIDESVETVNEFVKLRGDADKEEKLKLLTTIKSLLLEPHEFFQTKQEVSTSRTYLDQKDTWPDWKRRRQAETKQVFGIQNVDPATELNEAFEQWGERRQFKRLRRQQLALEQSNKMRAAFNAYTNNLVFGESYVLNASREERKRMIRQYNQLPDVTSVIRSDLDLRDLYRNQVLTAMDDAKAELTYQLRNNSEESKVDLNDLLSLLKEAQTSCNEWFKFVPEEDVKEALAVVVGGDQN